VYISDGVTLTSHSLIMYREKLSFKKKHIIEQGCPNAVRQSLDLTCLNTPARKLLVCLVRPLAGSGVFCSWTLTLQEQCHWNLVQQDNAACAKLKSSQPLFLDMTMTTQIHRRFASWTCSGKINMEQNL